MISNEARTSSISSWSRAPAPGQYVGGRQSSFESAVLAPLLPPQSRPVERNRVGPKNGGGWRRGQCGPHMESAWQKAREEKRNGNEGETQMETEREGTHRCTERHWNVRCSLRDVPYYRTLQYRAHLTPWNPRMANLSDDARSRDYGRASRSGRGCCHHVDRAFALGRPELGFTTTRLSPLLSPGAEASIPRRRLRASPGPPFPTRAFSQRIGSKPAGATSRRPARTLLSVVIRF